MIEYLYQQFKHKALQYNFPLYIFWLLVYLGTITFHEISVAPHLKELETNPESVLPDNHENHNLAVLIGIINLLCALSIFIKIVN